MHANPQAYNNQRRGEVGWVTYRQITQCSFTRDASKGDDELWMGRDAKDCIRQDAARGQGAKVTMLALQQSWPATRFALVQPMPDHPAIHPFIRLFVAWGTGKVAQLMHRVLRVINALSKTLQQEQPTLHTYSTQHLRSTCLQ